MATDIDSLFQKPLADMGWSCQRQEEFSSCVYLCISRSQRQTQNCQSNHPLPLWTCTIPTFPFRCVLWCILPNISMLASSTHLLWWCTFLSYRKYNLQACLLIRLMAIIITMFWIIHFMQYLLKSVTFKNEYASMHRSRSDTSALFILSYLLAQNEQDWNE